MTNRTPPPQRPSFHPAAWLRAKSGVKPYRAFRVRLVVQGGFALLSLLLGVQFARFLAAARAGELPLPVRPPGVEGFLPISGMMGLLDWFHQGKLNDIHPAATILFLVFVLTAFLLRKAFCSWICPVGFLSESLARLGQKLFKRNFRPHRAVDLVLRGLKYLLLGFFLWAIFGMSAGALRAFIESPYNRVSDVKMYLFFARIGEVAAIVLVVLAVLSVFVQGAWCRYLCPYGALLGFFSWRSPVRIARDDETCTECGICDRVCMARLPVSRRKEITSVECTGCLDCVAACPVKPALALGRRRRRIGVLAFAAAVVIVFVAGYGAARLAGLWRNSIPDAEYVERIGEVDHPRYAHPGAAGM